MQEYADIYLLQNYATCFGCPSHQSSGVHKSAVAASCTDHTKWGATFFKRDQIRTAVLISSRLRKPLVYTVTTVLCAPDDGRDGRPKHVK